MDKVIGIGLYRKDQWPLLLKTADDFGDMETEYENWLKGISRLIENMRMEGIEPVTVDIDIYELISWCRAHNLKNDGGTRSLFVAELLKNGRAKKEDKVIEREEHVR